MTSEVLFPLEKRNFWGFFPSKNIMTFGFARGKIESMPMIDTTLKNHLRDEFSRKTEKKILLIGPTKSSLPPLELSTGLIIGVDGGAELLSREQYHFTIGDGDSLRKNTTHLDLKLNPEKELSDYAACLNELSFLAPKEWHLWGFCGERLDHELSLWGDTSTFLTLFPQQTFFSHSEKVSWCAFVGKKTFQQTGTFSVFCLTKTQLSIKGEVKYPLTNQSLSSISSLTLSNEATGSFTIESTGPCFVYWPHSGTPS